jgi:hypothetical protein
MFPGNVKHHAIPANNKMTNNMQGTCTGWNQPGPRHPKARKTRETKDSTGNSILSTEFNRYQQITRNKEKRNTAQTNETAGRKKGRNGTRGEDDGGWSSTDACMERRHEATTF